jgi:predicted Zn-dependent peptidase
MLDRTQPPAIKAIGNITFPKVTTRHLSNGIPVHLITDDSEDVLRVDFMFGCGIWHQSQPLVANMTVELLREGTKSFTSQQIAEKLDFYGSWLQLSGSYHYSYITVYSLCKFLPDTLNVIESMLKESIFPETEFEIQRNKRKQIYLLEQQKVQSLASKRFSECVFGENHPYGRTAIDRDFDSINTSLLKNFYNEYYHAGNCQIILSGKISNDILHEIENRFGGKDWWKEEKEETNFYSIVPLKEKQQYIEKADSVQAALRLGFPSITRKHPDYYTLKILATVLGGYFGSRLMTNIREEKGYTYGIGASLSCLREGGSFSIATQTANEYVKPLIQEVYNEMEKLCKNPISKQELSMVRNYLLGETARAFDGTFSIADGYISLLANDLTPTFYEDQLKSIKEVSAENLQQMSINYFKKEDFYEVVVGSINRD